MWMSGNAYSRTTASRPPLTSTCFLSSAMCMIPPNDAVFAQPGTKPVGADAPSTSLRAGSRPPIFVENESPAPTTLVRAAILLRKFHRLKIIERQSNVVFCQRLRRGTRFGHIFEFRELPALVKCGAIRKPVQHRSHPPRKPLHQPYTSQTHLGVAVQKIRFSVQVESRNCFSEQTDIGHRQIQSFGSGRRHNVRRVSCQVQAAVLHWLDNKAAHSRDPLLQDRSFDEFPSLTRQANLQLLPDSFIRPVRDIFIRRALQIQSCDLRRTHAVQSKPAMVVAVDQFLG